MKGKFSGSATFGTLNVNANTSQDLFVARYNSNGECLYVINPGCSVGHDVLAATMVHALLQVPLGWSSLVNGAYSLVQQHY
ncbi:MAG: hypothetical protein Kow0068_16790 [Marinilabiliales bacterium]